MAKLFTDGESNTKTAKSSGQGYETKILHFAPAKESGYEMCSSRSPGCTDACLYTAGRGRMDNTKKARIRRTIFWVENREAFKAQIVKETTAFVKRCEKKNLLPAIRMNGTSDVFWENQWPELMDTFSMVQFYDYTKHIKRVKPNYSLPANYHLTFSRSENNDHHCLEALSYGLVNVAVVFDSKDFPTSMWGCDTYSADDDDLRFLDPPGGHIGCLYAKGDGKKDKTGFVLPVLQTVA